MHMRGFFAVDRLLALPNALPVDIDILDRPQNERKG
jgi:hypothetical protein